MNSNVVNLAEWKARKWVAECEKYMDEYGNVPLTVLLNLDLDHPEKMEAN